MSPTGLARGWEDILRTFLVTLAALVSACQHGQDLVPPGAERFLDGTASVHDMMAVYETDGLVVTVVKGDEIVLSDGWGVAASGSAVSEQTACGLYSATKFLSSLTYAHMAQTGAFDLDQDLGALLDGAPEDWSGIPFWRLLNHTSGLPMVVIREDFQALSQDPETGNAVILDILKDEPLDYPPGAQSRYRQSGYGVAEVIVSETLGTGWSDLVDDHVLHRPGLSETFHTDLRSGARQEELLTSAGGYQTTADDMGRLFRALNADGLVDEGTWSAVLFNPRYIHENYGLGTILVDVAGERTLGHSGGGRANIRYAPDAQVGVFVCTDDTSNNGIHEDLAAILMEEALTGAPALRPGLSAVKDRCGAGATLRRAGEGCRLQARHGGVLRMREPADLRREMVARQLRARGIRDEAVLAAMGRVPREAFVPEPLRRHAYEDRPLPLGEGQTISQPYIVAVMVEALRLSPADTVLEIGAGSGYAAAVMAEIAGRVFAVERIGALARRARENLEAAGYGRVEVREDDGTRGWPSKAPFDAVLVSAGAPAVPETLKDQLGEGGRLVVPVGADREAQELLRLTRRPGGGFDRETLTRVRFVPLIGEAGWAKETGDAGQRPRDPGG